MDQYYSNVPTHPLSIKKINKSNSLLKGKYTSQKELQKRSKSNASYSSNYNNVKKNNFVEKAFYHKSNYSKSKFFERSKEVNQLNYSQNAKEFKSNLSLNGSHVNISFNQNKNRIHSESFTNLPPKNKDKEGIKIRDKTLDGLKLNLSQDKIKLLQMVTVKASQKCYIPKKKHQLSLEGTHHNNRNNIKSILEMNRPSQPFKLYTEGNTNCQTTNHNESVTLLNTSHQNIHHDCSINKTTETMINNTILNPNIIKDLEQKLLNKLSQNKANSKTKKYNTFKNIFEELIKTIPNDNQTLFLKLLNGYHEVVSAFANENKGLKETNEIFQNNIFQLEKANIQDTNIIKEKDKEIKKLKTRIAELEKNPEQIEFSKSTNTSTQMQVNSNEKELHSNYKELIKNNLIIDINKENLNDLDALYFFDKVQMNTEGGTHHCIPILPINSEQDKNNKKKENSTNMIYANILGKLKNTSVATNTNNNTMNLLPHNKQKTNLK